MNLAKIFIHRPISAILLSTALFVFGFLAYLKLPIAALPQIDFPTIQVDVALPGASADTMAANVAGPLERQFALINGVVQMTSKSVPGSTSVLLQFSLNRNIDSVAQEVQSAINRASAQLPSNLPSPPTFFKVNPANWPMMILAVRSDTVPLNQLSDYADNVVAQKLSNVDGVGLVYIGGQQKPAVRIQIDPRKVASLGLQLDAVRTAIANNTSDQPKGQLVNAKITETVLADDQVLNLNDWRRVIVGFKNGAAIRIEDLGNVIDGVEDNQSSAWAFAGKENRDPYLKDGRTILLLIFRQPGANVIQTVEGIKSTLPSLRLSIPPAIELHVLADRTQAIKSSVDDVKMALLIAVILVVFVMYAFLRKPRSVFIPALVIPLSLAGTFLVMSAMHYTLDNLSLMALSIAVGFVVDDAVIMTEVIWRRIEEGEPPFSAALSGSGEVAGTLLATSISLIVVFTPLMFMGGVVGRMMTEFAICLSAAVTVSLGLSLTLTPMLASRLLKSIPGAQTNFSWQIGAFERSLSEIYEKALRAVLGNITAAMMVLFFISVSAVALYASSPTGFFPQQDTGFLTGLLVLPQGSSNLATEEKLRRVALVLKGDPAIENISFSLGAAGSNQASINITLAPRAHRAASAAEVIDRLRPQLLGIAGVQVFLQARQDISLGGKAGTAQFEYTLTDVSLSELNTWIPKVREVLEGISELKDVNTDASTVAAIHLTIDRETAGRFGITPTDIDNALYDQIGQRQVAQFFTQVNSYHVILEAPPASQESPDLFKSIYIVSPLTGKPVPLSLLVAVDPNATTSSAVTHEGRLPAAMFTFNLSSGVSLGEATSAIQAAMFQLRPPPTLMGSFKGIAEAFQQSLATEPVLIFGALIAVYVILGILYESLIHPLTVLSTLPSAGLGALLAMRFAHEELNVIGIIAIILLIGIVKKNGIMIVDVALRLEREMGLNSAEAAIAASMLRVRPILMTTACALLAAIPLIVGDGLGSEFRRPLGWALVGGLAVSQILTLFTTPALYVFLDRYRGEGKGWRHAAV